MIEIEHGTNRGYDRCRKRNKVACKSCRAAHSQEMRDGNDRRHARLLADPTCVEHGRATTYNNWLCRCRPCTTAAGVASSRTKALRAERLERQLIPPVRSEPGRLRRDVLHQPRRTPRAQPIGRDWLAEEEVDAA